jgi:O-antigen/teichoic acid export membrane protein
MRTSTNSRSYLNASITGLIGRGVSIVCRFLTVPLLLSLLGAERYGLWLIIASFLAWLSMTDLGLIAAVQTPLIQSVTRGKSDEARSLLRYVWSKMTHTGVWLTIAGIIMLLSTPIHRWLGVSPEFKLEFMVSLGIACVVCAASLPLKIFPVVAYSNDRGYLPPVGDVIIQISLVLAVALLSLLKLEALWFVVTVATVLQFSVSLGLFKWTVRSVGWADFKGSAPIPAQKRRDLRSTGIFFLCVSIGEGLVLQTDAMIIGAVSGPESIAAFSVPAMFLTQFLLLQNAFLRPLWAVFTKANEGNDGTKLRAVLRNSLALSLASAIAISMVIIYFGDWFIRKWTGGVVVLSSQMALGFCLYLVSSAYGNLLALFCNAVGLVRQRLIGIIVFGLTKVVTGLWWLHHGSLEMLPGIYGLVSLLTDGAILSWIVVRHLGDKARAHLSA